MRRIPVIATLVVLIAAGLMIRLGCWQIDRMHQKEALLARLARNAHAAPVAFPPRSSDETLLFRRAYLDCRSPSHFRNEGAGKAGYRIIADCANGARVQLGTTLDPTKSIAWPGGTVTGTIVSVPDSRPLIVAAISPAPPQLMLMTDRPQAGLAANPPRTIAEIPNNHLSYAVQWFFFAATALVIYALALAKRNKRG